MDTWLVMHASPAEPAHGSELPPSKQVAYIYPWPVLEVLTVCLISTSLVYLVTYMQNSHVTLHVGNMR